MDWIRRHEMFGMELLLWTNPASWYNFFLAMQFWTLLQLVYLAIWDVIEDRIKVV